MLPRSITVLFRRDPSLDRESDSIALEGYAPFWPDGQPVNAGLNAFCRHGQRLLGLGKHLRGCQEKLVRVICHPIADGDADMTRVKGYRVRRFILERRGFVGRIHFLDGTPTSITFDLDSDERPVIEWIGLHEIADGCRQWMDIAAVAAADQGMWPAELEASAALA